MLRFMCQKDEVLALIESILMCTMKCLFIDINTTLTNFSTKYLVMFKVYTDVGGIK